jgi:hypothetical protein
MTVKLMTVEANDDAPTQAAYDYRDRNLYQVLDPATTSCLMLRGRLATQAFFSAQVVPTAPDYLVGVGHGEEDVLLGFSREAVIERGKYQPAEVAGRIVHLLACHTAMRLGRDLVKKGAVAFIGYDRFVMVQDEIIDEFMECDTEIDLALLAGATVRQAYGRAMQLFDGHIARMEAEGRLMKAALLKTNRAGLVCPVTDPRFGDAEATLF